MQRNAVRFASKIAMLVVAAVTLVAPPSLALDASTPEQDFKIFRDYFVKKFSEENDRPKVRITKKIIGALESHTWPGNVRELQHLIERATLLSEDGSFPDELLPEEVHTERELLDSDKRGKLQEVLDWLEKKMILDALERNAWNQVKAAKELGLNETTLRRRIKRHRIKKTGRI